MRPRDEYRQKASEAYEKYVAVQAKIDKIEASALAAYGDVADYQLATAERYWVYRKLCKDRSIFMQVVEVNSQMATMLG